MDFSCKSVAADQRLLAKSAGSEIVQLQKPLTFGVDRILASDKKDLPASVCEVKSYLPQLHQFIVSPQQQLAVINQGILNGQLMARNLIRPQAVRINESSGIVNTRDQLMRDQPVDYAAAAYHRLPFAPALYPGQHHHHSHIRFNPALHPKFQMGHPMCLVQTRSQDMLERRTSNSNSRDSNGSGQSNTKRKRSWSRAVFSNLQRKGLEIAFGGQKYITKPDRRKLAARLGLTDAQVKVWFQNRRMKWRHTGEDRKAGATEGKSKIKENGKASSEEMFSSSDEESMGEDEIDVMD